MIYYNLQILDPHYQEGTENDWLLFTNVMDSDEYLKDIMMRTTTIFLKELIEM